MERLITLFLAFLLLAGMAGIVTAIILHREAAPLTLRHKSMAPQAARDREADDSPADNALAAKQDAQGDQASDE